MDVDGAFRGSRAVASGALTRGELRGPRFRRVFPDVYAPAGVEDTFALRSRAAYVLLDGAGVLAGYSAAELLDASCGPPGAPAEVLLFPGRFRRSRPDLVVRRDRVDADEIVRLGPVQLTCPRRTALDLACWAPTLTEKVVAVDALTYRHRFDPGDLRPLASRHLGSHGSHDLPTVLRLANRLSESPMESRIRMAIHLAGLPVPAVQHRVQVGGERYRLDLAYPDVLLAIEYDGGEHRTAERARRDLVREARLTRAGWYVLRFGAGPVLHHPDHVAAVINAELIARSVRSGSSGRR